MTDVQNSFLYKLKYYSYFVTRAFLLAVFGFLLLLAIFFVIYLGDLFINVKTGNYKSPLFGGYVIVSPSMVPTINVNDAIVIKRSSNGQYNIGDISYFSTDFGNESKVITHRVVKKKETFSNNSTYITKGDNNPIPDRYGVNASNIYGKVFLIIPKLGYVQSYLSNPFHFLICILIPSGILFLYEIIRMRIIIQKSKKFY